MAIVFAGDSALAPTAVDLRVARWALKLYLWDEYDLFSNQ